MSSAQVVVRWNLQHGVCVVPKCSSKAHALELVSTKALSPGQMKRVDEMEASTSRRFISPPFMLGGSNLFCFDYNQKIE